MAQEIDSAQENVWTDAAHTLYSMAQGEVPSLRPQDVYRQIPRELTIDEISRLGTMVRDIAEQETPSWDGYSHGRKVEISALGWLGLAAIQANDPLTNESVISHLKSRGLKGRREALILKVERWHYLS